MTTLEDLYYGNISPCERDFKCGSQMEKIVKRICKNEESLISTLTEQQKETFDKFRNCESELPRKLDPESFIISFKLAARIVIEVMGETLDTES